MKLSIVIPTYNRSQLLPEAIGSILKQQPVVYEVVIADDCSTDNTWQVCQKFQDLGSHTRLIWLSSDQNLGAQVARNRGLAASTGDVVLFMDSDDVLSNDGLYPLLDRLDTEDSLDYVYGKVIKTCANLQTTENSTAIGEAFSQERKEIAGYHWHTMGAIYRRDYLEKVGPWHEKLTGSQDWEFQARVKLSGGHGEFIDSVVGFWRDHSEARVGAKEFRRDYVESVIEACFSIHHNAYLMGKLDKALEKRLVKKLLLHVLELSSNGFSTERTQYLQKTYRTLRFNTSLKLAVRSLSLLNSNIDSILWRAF